VDDCQGPKPIQFRQTVVRENQIGRRGGEFVAQFAFGPDARQEEIEAVTRQLTLDQFGIGKAVFEKQYAKISIHPPLRPDTLTFPFKRFKFAFEKHMHKKRTTY
jgi:hypothetical protein